MRVTTAFGFLIAAFAIFQAGSVSASVTSAVVPDQFATVQDALDALDKKGPSTLRIMPGIHQGPAMATQFSSLRITADPGATIVATGSEPALTICASGVVYVSGLAIESESVGLFVNGVGRVAATALDITAASHGVLAESSMSTEEIRATFGLPHAEGMPDHGNTIISVTSSVVTSEHGDAIRIGTGESAQIVQTTLAAPEGDGIHGTGPSGTIEATAVTIRDAGDDGIDVTGPSLTLVGSTIERPADYGVTVGGGRGQIANTTIVAPGGVGIESHGLGSFESISGANVSGAGGDAMRVWCLRVMDCTVSDAAGDGIHVAGPADAGTGIVGIASNRVERVGGEGITSAVAGMPISQNTVIDTGGAGIVAGADRSRVEWNMVSGSGDAGIVAAGDRVQVFDNDVRTTTGDGVNVSGIDVFVTDNSVELAGIAGIRVASEGAYVSHNEVVSPAGDGIVVARGWSEVVGDTVSHAGGDGICVLGDPARAGSAIRENVVSGSAADGIDIGPANGARVAANTITGCGDCGIRLGDGAKRNRLTGNSAQESGSYDLYESDESRRNRIARSNRFRTRHRSGR